MTLVLERTDHPLPQLELPSWLPPPVAEQAERLYDLVLQGDPKYRRPDLIKRTNLLMEKLRRLNDPLILGLDSADEQPFSQEQRSALIVSLKILCRLVSDERMNRVWNELYRRKSGSNEFLNPVQRNSLILDKLTSLHDPKNQDKALQAFLKYAYLLAAADPNLTLMTQAEVASKLKQFTVINSRLRENAQDFRALGLETLATKVEAVAMDCEKSAYKPEPNVFFPIVDRSRGNQVERGFIIRLSGICLAGFEKGLTGTVATTASVALSKEITRERVREIVRAHAPGVNCVAAV
jgi:hypothetical protein